MGFFRTPKVAIGMAIIGVVLGLAVVIGYGVSVA